MSNEKNFTIEYNGSPITMLSNERSDFVNLTQIAVAHKDRKSILSWLRSKTTIEFLHVWETRYNPDYDGAQLSTVYDLVRLRTLSIKNWVELTNATGIDTRVGEFAGTYAHRDIAIRFAGWINPEFELYLVEEIQRLKKIEEKAQSYDLLTHEQVLALVQLKEMFKYVAHQEMIEEAHKEVHASKSNSTNPFAEFNKWRNKILNISPEIISERIEQFCRDNGIPMTKRILNKSKREKILMMDSLSTVRNAVWDFLEIKGEINSIKMANLVERMIRTERGEVYRENETNLFQEKQDFGVMTDFKKALSDMPEIKTARQLLEYKKEQQKQIAKRATPSQFNNVLGAMMKVPPPKKE